MTTAVPRLRPSDIPESERHFVELDLDNSYDLIDAGLPEDTRAIVAAALFVSHFDSVDSVRVVQEHGPGGGNPVIEFGGTKDGLNALLASYFNLGRPGEDLETYRDYKIV